MVGETPRTKPDPLAILLLTALVGALVFAATWKGRGVGSQAAIEADAPVTAAVSAPAAEADATSPEVPPAAAAEPQLKPPVFDLVRVEPDGSSVVAGTADPGADITIYADDQPLAQVEADADGNFVAIFRAEPSAAPQALSLGSSRDGARAASDEVVMLLPNAPKAPPPDSAPTLGLEPARPAPSAKAATPPGSNPSAPEETDAIAPEATPAPPPQVAATAIVSRDRVEVSPVDPAALGSQVSLASISYADAGEVTLAGIGSAGSSLRAYVDDRLAKEAVVGGDGRWSLALDDVAAGRYTLRIDQLAPDGKVASRVETPFQRDYPRTPLPRPEAPGMVPEVGVITVQPGHNLWTLARLHYGSGVMYTQIFTANQELIGDPDLIYPGQIFTLPELDAAE